MRLATDLPSSETQIAIVQDDRLAGRHELWLLEKHTRLPARIGPRLP